VATVATPEALTDILRNDDGAWTTALALLGFFAGIDTSSERLDMLLTLDFEPHKEARRMLQPAFSPSATGRYLELAAPMFEAAIDDWIARGEVAFKPAIRRLLATSSARMFLGVEDPREGEMLDRALADIWTGTMTVVRNPWVSPSWRRALRAHTHLRTTLGERIPERRARGGDDLFSRLCAETRAAQWLDDIGIVRLFITVLLGAFDTTALGLTSMAYLLAAHPEWQERLREEALAAGTGRPSYDVVKGLEATDGAWKETLRLMPVTGNVFRVPLREVEVEGARIPSGTFVMVSTGSLSRDDRWWSDPLRFDPGRFAADRAEDKKHKGAYMPFSAGAHACIGSHLANLEAKAFWHAMLTRCRFSLQPHYEARHQFRPLGCVSGKVRLKVERL
jgi:cytochrome P450